MYQIFYINYYKFSIFLVKYLILFCAIKFLLQLRQGYLFVYYKKKNIVKH